MEIIVILFLIVLNGVFAMAEISLVSSKKIRLEEMAREGNNGAKTALKLLSEPERFLSTIQVGITLIGIVSGVYGGLTLASHLTPFIESFGVSAEIAYNISIVLIITVITYLSLVVGELAPKAIALKNPEGVSSVLSRLISLFSFAAKPLIWFLAVSTRGMLKIFGIENSDKPPVTEEELKMMIDQGRKYGVLEVKESEMMKSVFRFGDRRAYAVMTNRQDIVWIDINDDLETIRKFIYSKSFSKYPVCNESLDNLIGIMLVKDFLKKFAEEEKFDLHEIISKPLILPENISAFKVLEKFRETKTYVAIIVDEFGSIQGLSTLHDLVEDIFGELPDQSPDWHSAIFKREDGSLLVDGSIQIDDLKDKLEVEFEEQELYTSLGGFVMYKLNGIPQVGDKFIVGSYQFEVVDMDGTRVDKVQIQKITETT